MFKKLFSLALISLAISITGCTKGTEPTGTNLVPVELKLVGETSGNITFAKALGQVDSIKIDFAVIVLRWIQFKQNIDTVKEDSLWDDHDMNMIREKMRRMDDDLTIRFKGPFFVTLRNNEPTPIAVDSLPPGNYNGIKFKVHAIVPYDLQVNPAVPDSFLGKSIYVKGKIYQNGTWKDFVFTTGRVNTEFKIKGDFTITETDKNIPYVLVFDLNSWFIDPLTGRVLDPSDPGDQGKIISNIVHSLKGKARGGKDRNRDGKPD
ncbi:hypothetical protein [Candidatus Kryptobacter tengchongensis]|uniref:Uncharacterized protein n=1 Tax=Kryptobacter tengchongensis TaxID=1643429 RepID=A0A656D6T0_KRYT1|nr:hypothetical protein [Candidatus Kryptobacter tengchongensis]CUS99919.1 hypothetical protein JGI24_00688 [Candidatus Kryptobacter tengchongensis]